MHRTLDFLLAAAVIAVPLGVDFHDDTATVLMLVLGGAATLLAIGTNLSTGIIRILPPVLDGVADIAATIVLIVAPFVLGFTGDTVATVLYVVIGASGLGATLLTRFEPDLMPAARIAPNSPLSEPQPSVDMAPQRRHATLGVDDDPAVLAAVARHERGFSLAGPDVRPRTTSTPPRSTLTAGGLPSDRRALSRSRAGLMGRTHIGRMVGSSQERAAQLVLATISVGGRSWKTLTRPGA